MKNVLYLALIFGAIYGAGYAVLYATEPVVAQQPAKTVTLTEAELDKLVEQRMAHAMLQESRSLSEEILQPDNWHTAIFNGVKYTIYTGPGEVASALIQLTPVGDLVPEGEDPLLDKQ